MGPMDIWEISEGEGLVELLPKRRSKLVLEETTPSESKIQGIPKKGLKSEGRISMAYEKYS